MDEDQTDTDDNSQDNDSPLPRSQDDRKASFFSAALPKDALLIQHMQFSERLGQPFVAKLDLYSDTDYAIDLSTVIGTECRVTLDRGDGKLRFFHGYINRFSQSSRTERIARYHATMVPYLWFLTRTADCRIFQKKTIPEIVSQLLKSRGYTNFELHLSGTHTPKEYCVQYRETDFSFISRLLEREGIYYFFVHTKESHTMVMCDFPLTNNPYEEYAKIPYRPVAGDSDREYISDWTVEQIVQPGKYSVTDYDFKVPKKALLSNAEGHAKHSESTHEIFDYPGDYLQHAEGQDYARIRIEEMQAQHEIISATSDCMGIAAGHTFTLIDPPREDQSDEHLVTSAVYQINGDHYDSSGGYGTGSGGAHFAAHFTAIKSKTQFRPPRTTPKPFVQGPQTAIVTGKKGEEIWTEEHGRVKVQFHWDRYGKHDENSSCWVRVSHPWAGKGWGSVSIPRIGQEVVVDFLEGDPDQPIITGRVYNGDNKAPYPLPGGAVISGLKSNSTKGGGGSNEMSMNDTKGKELINIHAQKDMTTTVEHNDTQHIKVDRSIAVDGTHNETIKGATNITIVTGPFKLDVQKNTHTHHVNGDVMEWYDANQGTTVGKTLQIVAGDEIKLICGSSLMSLKKDGTIKISGVNVEITGSQEGKLGVGNQNIVCNTSKTAVAGAAINSSAVGIHEITGAVVKIN